MTDQEQIAQLTRERDEAVAAKEKAEASLNETFDDGETVWTRPTAWAWAQSSKVVNGRQLSAEKERDSLQAHNDVLVAALKPFVEAWDEAEEGDEILTNLDPGLDVNIAVRIRNWLAAKAALSHPDIQVRQAGAIRRGLEPKS